MGAQQDLKWLNGRKIFTRCISILVARPCCWLTNLVALFVGLVHCFCRSVAATMAKTNKKCAAKPAPIVTRADASKAKKAGQIDGHFSVKRKPGRPKKQAPAPRVSEEPEPKAKEAPPKKTHGVCVNCRDIDNFECLKAGVVAKVGGACSVNIDAIPRAALGMHCNRFVKVAREKKIAVSDVQHSMIFDDEFNKTSLLSKADVTFIARDELVVRGHQNISRHTGKKALSSTEMGLPH